MKYLTKTVEYGLYIFVFLLPLQTRWIIRAGELEYTTYSLYGTDILLIILLLFFLFYKFLISNFQFLKKSQIPNPNDQKNPKSQIPNYFIIGLLAVSFISIFFTIDKTLAIYKLGWLVLGAGLFSLLLGANYSRAKLIWSLLVGLALSAGLGIWQFLSQSTISSKWLGLAAHPAGMLGTSVIETIGADGVGERWLRSYGSLDHPNILGGVMAGGLLLVIGIILKSEEKLRITNYESRVLGTKKSSVKFLTSYFLLLIFFLALLFSFSRAAWLGLAAGLAIWLGLAVMKKKLLMQRTLLEVILAMAAISLVIFLSFTNLFITRTNNNSRLEIKSISQRFMSYKNSLVVIKEHWLLGTGLGNHGLAIKKLRLDQAASKNDLADYFNQAAKKNMDDIYQPAHNVYLLVFSEVGVFGFILFVGLIVYLLIFNFQSRALGTIFKQFSMIKFSNPSLKISENENANDAMINMPILIAVIVLASLDHWLWSLHFGVLFFWLIFGLILTANHGVKQDI